MNTNGNEVAHLRQLLERASRKLRKSAVTEITLQREVRDLRRRLYLAETELHIAWALGGRDAA